MCCWVGSWFGAPQISFGFWCCGGYLKKQLPACDPGDRDKTWYSKRVAPAKLELHLTSSWDAYSLQSTAMTTAGWEAYSSLRTVMTSGDDLRAGREAGL